MTEEAPSRGIGSLYAQYGGVEMRKEGNRVFPDFRFEDNPGMSESPGEIGYLLGDVPKGEGVEYAFEGEPEEYPEMDFRDLANGLGDGRTIPNTTYLTHAIHKHPAIFIPHIPSYIIRQFTTEKNEDGERPLVLDPFSGSGTTGLEAKINGRDYVGIEINPLSRLVSEVSTSPIPPSCLEAAEEEYLRLLDQTEERVYEEYDAEFLDRTNKEHWFEPVAIRDLSRIRKALADFIAGDFEPLSNVGEGEQAVVDDLGMGTDEVKTRLDRWLTLMIANTVFEVSNADPGVSKAYKSKKMRRKIEEGDHPPDILDTHAQQLKETRGKLVALWNDIYDTNYSDGTIQQTIQTFGNEGQTENVANNAAHKADVDIRLGDARTFDIPEHREGVDLAVTSPPYINAMNYYRGSKLRLFWIYDFLEEDEKFDAKELRQSIIGTNSVSMSKVDRELPAAIRDIWCGTDEEYEHTRLPHLDADIEAIHHLDHNEAERKAYVTWKFFGDGMLKNLARVYEHLKPGGYYFFVIGENTIGERLIHSHKYVADIAQNLGKFEGHGGDFEADEGFRLVGSAWDRITNRDLFKGRKHNGGVIECEWATILQKPRE
ncbi:DNA methyltransferase [Haloferax sulfurifontis]|uniref:site-specific DNA-methyltransferase (cytosine-N(4)-specific) n=1 Tax=Haloferax sulfurifontis ATCC BAA-897 TaxID=662480 RepID=M0HZV1_9EURY|nr:DNA methyltransferase [Haloferax sulfurifontis]ELZ89257.1 modification methylase [Haloferax sulfurifontis ATCC BAA-897]